MLGRREVVAAAVAALMAGLAVVVLVGLGDAEVVEVRVQGGLPAAPVEAGQVVWAEKGDIWIYDTESDKRRALTTDGAARYDFKPHFRNQSRVTYLTSGEAFGPDPALVEIDLISGQRRTLQHLPGFIRAYDWNPDGIRLAYYNVLSYDAKTELHITGAGPSHLRRFAAIKGRGGFINYDETRIEWASDGRRLLLSDTALDTSQDETLYILDVDGSDAAAPRVGSWARWSADGRAVYCHCATTPAQNDWRWQAIDVAGGLSRPLLIPAAARPSLSPDGRLLAFDDGADTPSIFVIDLAGTGAQPRFLARAAIAPLWLDPSRLAVTDTRPCPDSEDDCLAGGHGSMFEPAGTASALDLHTGRRTPLPPIPTDGADTP